MRAAAVERMAVAEDFVPPVDAENLSDLGNARRLVRLHGEDLRYCEALRSWLVWDGQRWLPNSAATVTAFAKQTIGAMYREAAELDGTERSRLAAHALRSESERGIRAMIGLAQSERSVLIQPDDLDSDPFALNVLNGTIDLRTGQLRQHRRTDLLTKLVSAAYDLSAERPLFEGFLERITEGSGELKAFLKRALGYAATGDVRERCIFILYGSGRNGKSTLLELFRELLADYSANTPTQTLMAKRGDSIPNDLARLKGARFVTASESARSRRLDDELVKRLTGRDVITARFMRAEFFEFRPQFKLFLATNHKPAIRDTSRAIWDRIRLVPFRVTITDEEKDDDLPAKLRAELPGILRWTVEGCREWLEQGLGAPPEVADATAAYRRENDVLGDFLEERCVQHATCSLRARDLYTAYVEWCKANGEEPASQRELGIALSEKGFERYRGTAGAHSWKGIGLATEDRE